MNITESLARIMFRGSVDLRDPLSAEGMCILTPRLPGTDLRVTMWISEYDRKRMVGEYDIVVTDLPTGANFRVRRAACALGCRCAAELVLDDPTPTFTDTQRDAILCGLRMLQLQMSKGIDTLGELHLDLLTNNNEHYPITSDEINDLCDLINPPVPHGGDEVQQSAPPRCPVCGSEDVAADGAARWDKETGDWGLSDVHDSTTCGACGYESDMHKFFEGNNNGQG